MRTAGLVLLLVALPAAAEPPVLARVEVPGSLTDLHLPVRAHLRDSGGTFALVVTPRSELDRAGVTYRILAADAGTERFGLAVPHVGGGGGASVVRLGEVETRAGTQVIPLDREISLVAPGRAPVIPGTRNERVAEAVGKVRTEELTGWIARLSGEVPATVGGEPVTITSRCTCSGPQIAAATQLALEELSAAGLSTKFFEWQYGGTSNRDVVAELPGGARRDEIVLMTAHLDDRPVGGPAPGADDNGSGSAAVLTAARILKGYVFDRTVRFVLFTGEEQGLFGSKAYAARLHEAGEKVVAVVNLDMIGWDARGGPWLNLHTRLPGNPGAPADTSVALLFADAVGWYGLSGSLSPRVISDGVLASDHSPFWDAGIPGILAIEDDLEDFNPTYHSSYDRLDRLNLGYLTAFAKAALATVAHLAGPADPASRASFFVPVVLSSSGANGSTFTSELTLTNLGKRPAVASLTYTASAGGGDGATAEALPAGTQKFVPDVIELFRSRGLPLTKDGPWVGTLRIDVDGLEASSDAAVTVRTTTRLPAWSAVETGRAGLAYPGLAASALPSAAVVLPGLRTDGTDRSNVAVQNAGGEAAGEVTLGLTYFDGASRESAERSEVTLAPGGFVQLSLLDLARGFPSPEGYVRVERISGTAPWYAYGVINDQVTSDGSFVTPETFITSLPPPVPYVEKVMVPAVVEAGGYFTELSILNLSGGDRDLELTFSSPALATPTKTTSMKLSLKLLEQKVIPDVVAALRESGAPGFEGASPLPFVGPLSVTVPSSAYGIVVMARTLKSVEPGNAAAGRCGVAYRGVGPAELLDGPTWLPALRQDATNRTNLALLNAGSTTGAPITLRIELFDGESGLGAGELVQEVPSGQLVQIDGILLQAEGALSQGYARITRVSGTAPYYAYAVVNDGAGPGERSGDGTFVPPVLAP